MRFSYATHPFESEGLDSVEVATLAYKFYQDSNCQDGHDRENWLCAEYLLTQKELIQRQIASFHNRQN